MSQEDKQLLLKDLCARLPYGIKAQLTELDDNDGSEYYTECRIMGVKDNQLVNFIRIIKSKEIGEEQWFNISFFKPYLRPMSSMTEEEKEQVFYSIDVITDENYGDSYSPAAWEAMNYFVEYCDSHYLDHRGLIQRGLALEAPKEMYC